MFGRQFLFVASDGKLSQEDITSALADPAVVKQLKWLAFFAPFANPDHSLAPVGIALACWRHTALEDAYAGSAMLSDAVMAKLTIATTRSLQPLIAVDGIDWLKIRALLTDPTRALPDGRTVGELVGKHWPAVLASISEEVDRWVAIEQQVGPHVTMVTAAATGSSDYTRRWWGTPWWPAFAAAVYDHVVTGYPESLHHPTSAQAAAQRQLLIENPAALPDTVLATLIDPPDGAGLRYGTLK